MYSMLIPKRPSGLPTPPNVTMTVLTVGPVSVWLVDGIQ